jgi:putative ABC transport system permease protein
VAGEYLEALGVTLMSGRLLTAADNRPDAQPVVVVSEELARQAWPDENPLGKRVRRIHPNQAESQWMTIVGVVKDIKEDRFNFRIERPAWYVPYAHHDINTAINLVVRTNGDPAQLAASVRAAIRSVLPEQPIAKVMPMREHLADILATERFSAVLMGVLAALGLGLAALGLYGVLAWSVSQRTGEIGLRMALGARARDIVRMILSQGLKLVGTGLAPGLCGALLLARYLASALYATSAGDPAVFGLLIGLLSLAALLACWLPIWKATRTDPLIALRSE